jgi:hypothetical protein
MLEWLKRAFPWVLSHLLALAVGAGVIYLALAYFEQQRALREARQALAGLQTQAAKQQGFQAATPVSEKRAEAALSPEAQADLTAIKKVVRDTSVAVHALSQASLVETVKGTLTPATSTTPATCEDAFNRFRVNTSNCEFQVRQKFRFELTGLRGVDGKTRYFKEKLVELDPVTGLPIVMDPPPQVTTDVQITDEQPVERTFGLKILGGVDERLAPGLGVQWMEKYRVSLRTVGFYARDSKDLRGVVGLGWRPRLPFLDSQVSVGGGVGLSTKQSGMIWNFHITVPLATVTK